MKWVEKFLPKIDPEVIVSICYNHKMFTITTWNVNGIRAVFKNKGDNWWATHNPDVLCLQEIRARPDQLTKTQLESLKETNPVWNPADRPGYSGVATFSKQKLLECELGLGIPRFDQEGRVIQSFLPNFRLFNIGFVFTISSIRARHAFGHNALGSYKLGLFFWFLFGRYCCKCFVCSVLKLFS